MQILDHLSLLADSGFSPMQTQTALGIARVLHSITTQISNRGASGLVVSEKLAKMYQLALPNNQWHLEVSNFMAVNMAKLQQLMVDFATGPTFLPRGTVRTEPVSDFDRILCLNQRIQHSGEHVSFSVLGVVVILVGGGVIILFSPWIDTMGNLLQRLLSGKSDARRPRQWILNEKLQLQRLAYESKGQGVWSNVTDPVPVTQHGQLLDVLED